MSEERFMSVYSNLPLKVREEIVLVLDGAPISWNVAYNEIKHNTGKGKIIIEKLTELGVI